MSVGTASLPDRGPGTSWQQWVAFSILPPSQGQSQGLWAPDSLGVPVWAKVPTPSVLTSHAWGREGKQRGYANGVKGRPFAPQLSPAPPPVGPPKSEWKLSPGLSGLLGSRQRWFKGPHFQHLLRGKAPRWESGIHLAGTGEGAAICCPMFPLPQLRPGGQG